MTNVAIQIYNEALNYLYGKKPYPLNKIKAIELLIKSAELGFGDAMNDLGTIYLEGIHAEKDIAKALEWYKKGTVANDSNSYYNLGRMYVNGIGVSTDKSLGYKYCKMAYSINKNPHAAYFLGFESMEKSDYQTAWNYFLISANALNIPDAWHKVGWMIASRKIATANGEDPIVQALKYLLKSASQGYVPSMSLCGDLFLQKGMTKEAEHWFNRAASLNDNHSKNQLRRLGMLRFLK